MQRQVSPVNCDVISHLDWCDWGPSCVVNVVEKLFLHTMLLCFFLGAMSHTVMVLSRLDLWQHTIFPLLDIQRLTSSFYTLDTPPHFSASLKETCKMIFCHYRSNIFTTLSKLHLAGNMFQRLSTPQGVPGGLASIKASTRIGGQNVESGCSR